MTDNVDSELAAHGATMMLMTIIANSIKANAVSNLVAGDSKVAPSVPANSA